MRRTAIALLCVLTISSISRDHEREFLRFFRQIFRHFVGTSMEDLKPPSGAPCTSTTGC